MSKPTDKTETLCLVCGERGQIYATGYEETPFACSECGAWGTTENNVDTPYEDDGHDWSDGHVLRKPTE